MIKGDRLVLLAYTMEVIKQDQNWQRTDFRKVEILKQAPQNIWKTFRDVLETK